MSCVISADLLFTRVLARLQDRWRMTHLVVDVRRNELVDVVDVRRNRLFSFWFVGNRVIRMNIVPFACALLLMCVNKGTLTWVQNTFRWIDAEYVSLSAEMFFFRSLAFFACVIYCSSLFHWIHPNATSALFLRNVRVIDFWIWIVNVRPNIGSIHQIECRKRITN